MVASHVIVGLFSRIFVLIYHINTPKMMYDMFKTIIAFILKVNMQASIHFKGWVKTPLDRRFAPGYGLKRPI